MAGVIGFAAPAHADDAPGQYQSTVHARPKRDDGTPMIVLTARELADRGAQNLKEALELIPEIQVRQGGMGTRFDMRGAKPRSVLMLIDGVPVDEPYNGAYEISSIPITDIVEIRVQLAPASPLEGPGGDGGIIEVQTLRAMGNKRILARAVGGSLPYGEAAATGRTPLNESQSVALRASVGGHYAEPAYPVIAPDMSNATFHDRDHQEYAALRLEYGTERGRMTADAWYGHRAYFIPPSDTAGTLLQDITNQDAARFVLGGETRRNGFRLALGAYGEMLSQATDFFTDYTLANKVQHQDLVGGRVGGAFHTDRPWSWRGVTGLVSARLSVDGEGAQIRQTMTPSAHGFSTYGELALGGKLRWRWFSLEAAVGALLPFDNPSATWPEAKLVVGFQPHRAINILLIGARKGRLPTIRELYDPMQGNPNLHPEQTWHGEVQVQANPHRFVSARVNAFLRQDEGLIRLNPAVGGMGNMMARNINLDTTQVRGFESGIDVARGQIVGAGITYIFEDANSPTLGFDPIANFPHHRVDTYLSTTFWQKRIGGMLRFRWTAEREVQGATLPRYYVFDFYAWGRITRNLRASVKIENLTNNDYLLLPGLKSLGTVGTATLEGVWE
jgi:outer membrane receptor protein involved in Fe transport